MKTKTEQKDSFNSFNCLPRLVAAMVLAALSAAPSAFAASQTWTNAPVDNAWTNVNNWVARAVPGALNQTGNSVNNDVVTINSPIPLSGIGGSGNPIVPDDAATVNTRSRTAGRILFDTVGCGAYVFDTPSPYAAATTTTPETGVLHLCHNGGVTLTAAVTNSQAFNMPIGVRLPSSTDGLFYLTNNATSPLATLFFENVYLDGATTRGVTFWLEGTNTGTNTIAYLSQSPTVTTGVSGIRKTGTGTWILSGPNNFRASAPINIIQGTLIVKDVNGFGSATTAIVTNTGVLQLDNVTLVQMYLTLNNGGTIQISGTNTLNGVAVGVQTGTSGALSTTSASDVITVGSGIATGAFVTGGGPTTVLNTVGPGTFVFAQANTYIGKWSFNAATNQLSNASALGTGPNANVNAGAILDLTPLGATTFVPTTSGFGGSGTGAAVGSTAATVLADPGATIDLSGKAINLTFTPTGSSGDTTHPALYIAQSTLSLNANGFNVNNNSGTPLGVGTYRLIRQATGNVAISGSGYAIVSGAGLATGTVAEVQVSGGNVDLVVVAHVAANLRWKGGNPDNKWDKLASTNFDNGTGFAQFGTGDAVTFDYLGSAYPTVDLVGTLLPASVNVNSTNDYAFTGSGLIAGPTSLSKNGTGALSLGTVNTYVGGTVVSNGTIRVGVAEAISSSGAGNVAVYGSGVIDLNGFANTFNGLDGTGTVDNQSSTPAVLTLGNNDKSGNFSGVLKNTSGTLAVTKIGTGTQSLSASNSYTGATTINAGTLAVSNAYALGPVSDLTMGGGTLDVRTPRLYLNSLAGSAGTIANNSITGTNTLVITGTTSTSFAGSIVDSASGKMALSLLGGTLRLNGANTFTGGVTVASGATLALGNSPASLAGAVVASNQATLTLAGGSAVPGTPASITTVDGASVLFTSIAEGNTWGGQFIGSATTTNRFTGACTAGGPLSFSNFLGVVQIAMDNASNPNFRFNNAVGGGDNTTFEFQSGLVHTRDAQTVRMGAISGGSATCGIGGTGTAGLIGTWLIGFLNTDMAFHGYITWSNNLVKCGSGTLTLDGIAYWTNTVTLPDPYEPTNIVSYTLRSNLITYFNWTTVSNGVLKIVAPNNLTNSSGVTLAGAGAVLDVSEMGYAVDQTTLDYNGATQPTNTVIVVTKTLDLAGSQSLLGEGTIRGSLNAAAGTTVAPGVITGATGTLTITNVATLNGAVNMELNRTASLNCDRIVAASFAGSGATLTITNIGSTLVTGDTFQLFSRPVNAFATVNLPTASADNSVPYTWTNMLAVNGSIKLLSGATATETNITAVRSGNTLQLSWPPAYTGWELQTNAVNVANTNFWFLYPGSIGTNQATLTIDPAQTNVFYRLHLQYTP